MVKMKKDNTWSKLQQFGAQGTPPPFSSIHHRQFQDRAPNNYYHKSNIYVGIDLMCTNLDQLSYDVKLNQWD